MIIDKLSNIGRYEGLNPRFGLVVAFLKTHNLAELAPGRYEIDGEDVFVNIVDAQPKTFEQARLETHNKMIDIQVVVSGVEQHGFAPRALLAEASYNALDDITFYDEPIESILRMQPGFAVIYFPEDAHAPAICDATVRKAIFKVRA